MRSQLTEENKEGGEGGNGNGVARLAHDGVDQGNGDGAHDSDEAAHRDVRHAGPDVIVTDGREAEAAVVPDEPARKRIQHLGQRGVDVKVVLAPEVLVREAAKVHLVEHDLVRMPDAPEAHADGRKRQSERDGVRRQPLLTQVLGVDHGAGVDALSVSSGSLCDLLLSVPA